MIRDTIKTALVTAMKGGDKAAAALVGTRIAEKAKAKGVELIFPVDFICADKFAPDAATQPLVLRPVQLNVSG